jgi:hypothetical protein
MSRLALNVPSLRRAALLAAVAASAVGTGVCTAAADEAQAKALLKGMLDYLAAQKTLSFDFDSNLDIVSKDGQKLTLASSGTVALSRPDKIRATRSGGFADMELVFDGKTASLLGKGANVYAQVDAPGTIDQLIDTLHDKYHRPLPGADLLLSDVYDQLMPPVTNVKDLGTGVIGGVVCDHLAFRASDYDWQIWIAIDERPYPCLYVITSTQIAGAPEYRVQVRNWKTGSETSSENFTFKSPANAQQLDLSKLANTDELPDIYAIGGRQ